jgi:hypothetical protein
MNPNNKIETKVVAATGGSIAATAVTPFILWLLGVNVWHASSTAGHAVDAVAAVPPPVSGLVLFVVSAAVTALAGYWAPHTSRPAPLPPPTFLSSSGGVIGSPMPDITDGPVSSP